VPCQTYLLTAIKPLKRFYKYMDKLWRRFLWAKNQQLQGGKCKVNWARVYQPLKFGGLGITDLERFGRALRLRWLWCQWKQSDKPWCNSELPINDVDEALFAAGTKVTVRNGRLARFWTASWTHGATLASMFLRLYHHSRRKNRTVAEALTNKTWIADLMHSITPDILAEYVMLWLVIDAAGFDPTDQRQDEIVWMRSASGEYSA
jgi:hypothetical protein